MKKRIGVIFGGRSGEHEVSVQSAVNIVKALDREKYEPVPIGMDHEGKWRLVSVQDLTELAEAPGAGLPLAAPSDRESPPVPLPTSVRGATVLVDGESGRPIEGIDVFFPIIHGTYGEDGCLQGLLRMLDVPFVGAGVAGSAVGMDKDLMKRLLHQASLPTPRCVCIRRADRTDASFEKIVSRIGSPVFVKPCNLGSSVGIHKVGDASSFEAAVDDALRYDHKVLVEEYVPGREVECSVLGNEHPVASLPGEIVLRSEFYSYEAKYVSDSDAELHIPAQLPAETIQDIQQLAVRAFQALECRGMARVDFFIRANGEPCINEINTLPGFTRISMYPKMWAASGIGYRELLDRLIQLAEEEHQRDVALVRRYEA